MSTAVRTLHIYFVLDRSGSMQSIASDVIGGFNSFLGEQRADGADALMTLVQFDSQDSHEVLSDATPIGDVPGLSAHTFVPRGATPLYDAMGHTIADATIRAERRATAGEPAEDILFVTFTDGLENQSVEYTRQQIFELITKRETAGWTFAFMGANQDSYAEGASLGYSAPSTQNWTATPEGTVAAMASMSSAVLRRRRMMRKAEAFDHRDFFESDAPADAEVHRS